MQGLNLDQRYIDPVQSTEIQMSRRNDWKDSSPSRFSASQGREKTTPFKTQSTSLNLLQH